jgi:DNA-binding beta-propeller fold protein YncE
MRRVLGLVVGGLCTLLAGRHAAHAQSFVNFESGHVRPLALSPDGTRLFAVNTPDNRLGIYAVAVGGLTLVAEVPVGLEPVAVATRTNALGRTEAWVVNHLSDSVSIVEVDPTDVALSRVTRTLATCDEPRDIVFAGTGNARAFVTTARRGQNCPLAANLITAGEERAVVQVWNANALTNALSGGPIANIELFTDTPRALAKSPGGDTVYAAGFHTGNQTTAILETTVSNSGNTRPPFPPGSTPGAPLTGLIVKFNPANGRWEDERGAAGPNWDPQVPFNLPDRDVFLIDALAATPALFASANNVVRVGTVIFNMAVRPDNGRVYVANTEARNEVRFEPFVPATGGGVQGNIVQSRISVIAGTVATPHHLNPHIDYTCVPPDCAQDPVEVEQSLAFPGDLVFSSDGQRVYVTGFGSEKIGVFDTDDLEAGVVTKTLIEVGAGPSGIVLDEARNQAYVMNRIDHTISIVSNANTPATATETVVVPLRYDPSPVDAKDGRIFLYDARRTSAHGDQACASCHVFGDFDSLAWDLGDPFGAVVDNDNPFQVPPGGQPTFHPLKGPMTTQSLRGMADAGPMHWRGDRTGASDPGGSGLDEDAAFKKFNPAFVGLLGRPDQLDGSAMQAFTDFILTVRYPPNPIRALTDVASAAEAAGQTFFTTNAVDAGVLTCSICHDLPLGTDGLSSIEGETQEFKVAHMRNLYQKIGMFGVAGDQVRGFGFLHDGSVFTVFNFLQASVFNFGSGGAANTNRRNVEAFSLAFDTGLKPAVGQQVSSTPATVADATVSGRIDLLIARADAGNCDLTVKGNAAGLARGWRYVGGNNFQPDRNAEGVVAKAALRALSGVAGQEQTYTCVPPGSGVRIGLDRDEDGIFDRRELDCGTDPADPGSFPSASGGCVVTTTSTSTSSSTSTVAPTTTSSSTTTVVVPTTTSSSTTLPPPITTIQSTALKIRDTSGPTSRRFSFKSSTRNDPPGNKVVIAGVGTPGDPTLGGASVTVYNSNGSGESFALTLPASGWTANAKGYKFRAASSTDPIQRVTVRSDVVRMRGGRAGFAYTLDEPSQGSVAVRLTLGAGTTWCANAPAKAGTNYDVVGKFVGQPKTPAPGACPAVP